MLTCANAILGQGQLSLAKYLLIVAREDNPHLDIHDIPAFFRCLLERIDWSNDLHFQTRTTIDTLDYSGTALNEGSKVIMAAVGPSRRALATEVRITSMPPGFVEPRLCLPGVLAIQGPPFSGNTAGSGQELATSLEGIPLDDTPLIVLVDDSDFTSRALNHFLWVTFTRSNPAADIYGIGSVVRQKHWGCDGSLIIDARIKPHHAPPLEEDAAVQKRVDALAAPGGPLHRII